MDPLTPRERQVITDVSEGLSNNEIALRRFIAPQTVKVHLSNIRSQLGLDTRVKLAIFVLAGELVGLRLWQEQELARKAEYDEVRRRRAEANQRLWNRIGRLQLKNDRLSKRRQP